MTDVLLIDDDELLRGTLEQGLAQHGHVVRTTGDGAAALAMIAAAPPDVLVSDMLMPRTDGVEVLREVRRRWPALPVVIMSGGGMMPQADLLTMARALGATETLTKPVRIAALSALIDRLSKREAAGS